MYPPIGVRVVTKPQKTVKDVLMKVKEKAPKKEERCHLRDTPPRL